VSDLIADATLFDITLPLSPDLPVWPGDPLVTVEPALTISRDGANVSRVTMSSHSGTHVDAPRHVLPDGATVEQIPPGRWIGPCQVIRVPDDAALIEPAHLAAAAIPAGAERVLLRTGNSTRWPAGPVSFDHAFVALSVAGAHWLVDHGVRLVGIDAPSIEAFATGAGDTHRTLLAHDVLIVEGLNLAAIDPGAYTLLCLPLRLSAGDGAPARVLLLKTP